MAPSEITADDVASHYDDLDVFYRRIWGDDLHHGLWKTGRESRDEAAEALIRLVAQRADIRPGSRVCDVGCGYGGAARLLGADYGARVTGVTISAKQHEECLRRGGAVCHLGDWLANGLPDAGFDAVIAIESTGHLTDVAHGIREMARVLDPGGNLVISTWMAGPSPGRIERRFLLDSIRRDGHLMGMGDEARYRRWIGEAGLEIVAIDDLSRRVRRTWPHCLLRSIRGAFRDGDFRRHLLTSPLRNGAFGITLIRIWIAYLTGAIRYIVFTATKPAGSDGNFE